MGRRRPQAPRHGRARRLRHRAEDRRLGRLARVRGRRVRARRDARRRDPRRGRDPQSPNDQVDPAPRARRRRGAAADRRPRRDLLPALGLQPPERAARGGGQEDGAEPAQRRRRLVAPEESRDHGLTGPVHLGLRARHGGRNLLRAAFRGARLAPRARLPHEPVRGAARDDRGRRARLRRVGDEARRARLRDRRDRDQGRLARPAAAARRAPCAAALGARLQVGADDRPDEAREDPHPRRADRQPQPLGAAGTGRGGRRDRLERDAPQRGGHQPQGHPRGRHGDRPARRRRDPAGGRAGAAARAWDEALPHAGALPPLRRADREARGRGHAPLSQPGVSLARARDAHPLGDGRDGHRGRRRAVRAPLLGRGPAPLDARPLPDHRRAAAGVRGLRRDLGDARRSRRSSARRSNRSRASSTGSTSRTWAG